MRIRRAERRDLLQLTLIFNQYRVFYNQQHNLQACKTFIKRRLDHNDSYIFVAVIDAQLVGFVQLYPSFSSVAMEKMYILNDLFVLEGIRKKGIASKLMQRAEEFANNNQACKLVLETHKNNFAAQKLYVKRGWKKDSDSFYFNFNC
ncbi:MAG: N-acetyltransferase family protein [Marinicellaceae bacterium]